MTSVKLNTAPDEVLSRPVAVTGVALFGEVARMYEAGYLARANQIATPTRTKEEFYLRQYIVPKWGAIRLNQVQPQAVEDARPHRFPTL